MNTGPAYAVLHGLFVPRRHDAAESVDDALEASAQGAPGRRADLVGLGLTAVLQLAVVAVSGSVALLADTIHNFSDALTAVPRGWAFVGGAACAASRRFTFGYGRLEDLAGLFIVADDRAVGGPRQLSSRSAALVEPQPVE